MFKSSRFYQCSFIGFLALFLSLGPAFHRAHLFHLHAGDELETSSCCHCCSQLSAPESDAPSISDLLDSGCDSCSICEFFKKFKSTDLMQVFQLESQRISFVEFQYRSIAKSESIPSSARGPPAC